MIDFLEFDTTPCYETCAQVGEDNYRERAKKEALKYIQMLEKRYPNKPEKSRFAIKWFPHDFGAYAQVVIFYDDQDYESLAYAFHVENHLPANWDDDRIFPFELDSEDEDE